MLRLRTVRAKLTALVALSIVAMLATLPLLSWMLREQLVDEVDDRVADAEKSFQEELDDDLADLLLAARVIAADTDTERALQAHDATKARELAAMFVGIYPEIDVLIVEPDGRVLAQVGCASALTRIDGDGAKEIAGVLALRREVRGMMAHGCETGATAPPAYVIAAPIPSGGAVIVCLPLNTAHLANAGKKLGLELALLGLGPENAVIERTSAFPAVSLAKIGKDPVLVEAGSSAWAAARFAPPQLAFASGGGLTLVAALDVTDIRGIVHRHLLLALAVLAVAAAISLAFGTRLARVMSVALTRVNVALKRLEQQDYVHIDALRTGDELEDLATGFNSMVDGLKDRDNLRSTFGKYMTASVMDHLLAGKVELGGKTLTVTLLFTDIRGFTGISEKMDAHSLVALLNEYFTAMVGIVMEEGGVVDKYIGDAIMAVFGAPVPRADDAVNAVRAAVRMRRALVTLNVGLVARGLPPLRTGIGIHTGEVVAGNIGSEARMEYTVIGDAVNLASRLESNTKELGVNVLISEDTYLAVKEHVIARPIREITVKGRAQPVMTYEVLGLVGEPLLARDEDAAVVVVAEPKE
jgi:adenylate cyclase